MPSLPNMHVLFLVLMSSLLVIATPVNAAAAAAGKEVPCDPVEKYTTEWFLQHTKPAYRSRFSRSPQLFYSRDMSDAARALALAASSTSTSTSTSTSDSNSNSKNNNNNQLVTIWDVWPCHLYWHEPVPRNPLRCIHNDAARRQRFFGNMSLAFARRARGGATVLHGYANFADPPTDGIWATVEYPELTRPGGPVGWLRKVRGSADWPSGGLGLGMGEQGMGMGKGKGAEVSQSLLAKIRQEWLASRGGLEWLRCVREEMVSWSEVFWKRVDDDRPLGPGELKRGLSDGGDEYYAEDDDDGDAWYDEDESCLSREALEFFDNAVDW